MMQFAKCLFEYFFFCLGIWYFVINLRRLTIINKIKTDKKSNFSIEHYPITNRFYPIYKGQYIDKGHNTGILKLLPNNYGKDTLLMIAIWSDTREGAKKIIEKAKEQQDKINVTTEYID